MTPMLDIRNVSHAFGSTQVLRQVSLTVMPGERLALIGPNGAGKTTLFNVLSGQLKPTEGQVWLGDCRVDGLPAHSLSRAGVARSFQVSQLFGTLTVAEHVLCALMQHKSGFRLWQGRRQAHSLHAQVDAVLEQFELSPYAQVPAKALSYAQQRLLDVALAMACRGKLLLLDEPTAGMSQSEAQRFVQQLQRVLQEQTLVFVEHDMQVAFALATRVAVLSQGCLVAVDTPEAIRQHPQVQRDYLGLAHA